MGIFNQTIEKFEDLVLMELKDLYDAEQRLIDALPKMGQAAASPKLKSAFSEHLEETRTHIKRLEKVFEMLGEKPARETCDAMKGLIAEGETVIGADTDDQIRDAGLIAAAQRVEHYEMAGYGTLRNFCIRLNLNAAADLLQQTLDEEGKADKILTQIAVEHVNVLAASR